MKTILRLIALLILPVCCAACTDGEEQLEQQIVRDRNREIFSQADQIGVWQGETPLWTFDPQDQQLAMCQGSGNDRFYIESDDGKQSASFSLPSSVKSAEPGANVQIHLSCRNIEELQAGAYSLEVVQRDTDGGFGKVWLWDDRSQTGFILYSAL